MAKEFTDRAARVYIRSLFVAAPKRTAFQIERDRRDVADLYLQGWTQARISEHLNNNGDERDYYFTRSMVGYDLRALQKAWQKSALVNIDKAKAQELAKVDRLEREYWNAWERSCAPAITTRQEGTAVKDGIERIISTSVARNGDPRFLQGVQWCIERRCKILGIDAPEKHNVQTIATFHVVYDEGPTEETNAA